MMTSRAELIRPFYVMQIMARAEKRPADAPEVVSMVVGEPDFPTPAPIIKAAQKALNNNRIRYTPALGLQALRHAIAQDYLDRDQLKIPAHRVAVTSGASAGLLLSLAAVLSPGDELLMTDPGYPCNRQFALAVGAVPKSLATSTGTHYQPRLEDIQRAWGPGTRAVLIASPANPTGAIVDLEQVQAIAEWVRSQGGWLIMDEIYLRLSLQEPLRSALSVSNDIISVNSFSKTYSMTGWRLGWLVVPDALIDTFERLAQNLFISPPFISQQAAIAAFSSEARAIADSYRDQFLRQSEVLLPGLQALGFELPVTPAGGFYGFFDVSSFTDDSFKFCEALCDQAGVLMAPGLDFTDEEPQKMVRVSFPKSEPVLQEGLRRIERFLTNS
ncbi:MAG: aminotransferase class I/II-fold pyridoxal phosphate-dependent enzyme [Bordetella sp.]|jgi:aspartate/methionine/tyrosine aminotransferase